MGNRSSVGCMRCGPQTIQRRLQVHRKDEGTSLFPEVN